MMFMAYNSEMNQWLCRNDDQTWGLTGDKSHAWLSRTADRLAAIGKAQKNRIPNAWQIVPVEDKQPQPKTDRHQQEASNRNKRSLLHTLQSGDRVVNGTWEASAEYNAVLEAIDTLSTFATRGYGIQLHRQLDELNRQMVDIEHYIQISSMSGKKSAEMAERIKNVMQNRRNIRQQIQLINRIHDCRSIDELLDGHIEKPARNVDKKYTPRSENGKKLFFEIG